MLDLVIRSVKFPLRGRRKVDIEREERGEEGRREDTVVKGS